MGCVAPQTRRYWAEVFVGHGDEDVIRCLDSAEEGLRKHSKTSRRHHHDWTIYRNCALREARLRGLSHPSLGT